MYIHTGEWVVIALQELMNLISYFNIWVCWHRCLNPVVEVWEHSIWSVLENGNEKFIFTWFYLNIISLNPSNWGGGLCTAEFGMRRLSSEESKLFSIFYSLCQIQLPHKYTLKSVAGMKKKRNHSLALDWFPSGINVVMIDFSALWLVRVMYILKKNTDILKLYISTI